MQSIRNNNNAIENRFIVFLINQLESFVGKVLNYLYTKVRFINQRYINNEVSMSELKTLDSLCDFKNFTFSPAEVNARKNTNTDLKNKLYIKMKIISKLFLK